MPHSIRKHTQLFAMWLAILLMIITSLPASARAPDQQPQEQPQSSPEQQQSSPASFLTGPSDADALEIAFEYLHAHRFALGLTEDDLRDIVVKDRYVTQHNGVTHLYLRQRLDGIEVFNGDINVNVTRDGRILSLGNRFISDLRNRVLGTTATLDAVTAVQQVAPALGLALTEPLVATSSARGSDRSMELSNGGISHDPILVRLLYQPLPGGHVRLAWNMTLRLKDSPDWLDLRADANTGEILSQVNWTADSQPYSQRRSIEAAKLMPTSATNQAANDAPNGGIPSNSYLVFDLPADSPHDSDRTLVTDPADATASPFGWHDIDGAAGPEYTTTQGNNTFTYADLVAPDGFGAGDATTDAGVGMNFSYPIDLTQLPNTYRDAALTNLFYVTNKVHDITYHYGFDEASGNFQHNNYGRGGLGNDSVKAEGQDYASVVNANFATPADGQLPRMQMFLGAGAGTFTINSPVTITGNYAMGTAGFGPSAFNLTGEVVLVNDNIGTAADGCQTPFVNASAIAGKIALIERGTCAFVVKATNAQANGAIAVIIMNNTVASAPPPLGGSDPSVTIPAISLTQADGNLIKSQLVVAEVVNVSFTRTQRDSSLDNGVIIHEYGHGISNRLTGGPSNSGCLSVQESGGMGEGWSDFLALALTAQISDTRTTSQTMGRWLFGDSATGTGIRVLPYNTDMGVNAYTFANVASTGGAVHKVGEIWATMLWEVYWNLVDDYGFDPDLYHGTGGNNLMLRLLLDGMKLQPCSPTFVDGRDAILLADQINNAGENQCRIWEGFAKRGLGYGATAGNSSSTSDGVESFLLPPWCMVDVQPASLNVCIPNSANFAITLGDSFQEEATLSVSGVPTNTTASFSTNPLTTTAQSTLTLSDTGSALPGSYPLYVIGSGSSKVYTTPIQLHLASATPGSVALIAPSDGISNVSELPTLEWQAAPQAASYLVEIAEDVGFATLVYTNTVQTPSLDLPYSLRSGRTYFWRVTANNGCGTTPSTVASFTVRVFPRLLVVDDDARSSSSNNVRSQYEAALSALNVPYDLWDTGAGQTEPSALNEITDYSTIIWFTGPLGNNLLPNTEPVLGEFLDGGKCLMVSAQDQYASNGLTPFMQEYLGVESAADDLSNGSSWHSVVTGTTPIFSDVGPYTLSFIGGNYTDLITPTVSAGLAFTGNAGPAAVYKDGGHYRSTYWGFGFETLPDAAARIAAMQRVLQFCDFQSDLNIAQQVTPISTLRPGQPVTYTVVVSNTGIHSSTQSLITATLPALLVDQNVLTTGVVITQVATGPTVWQLSDLAPGQSGIITVTGIVSPALNHDAFLGFQATVGNQIFDSDLDNNRTQPITLTAIVPRLRFVNATQSSAEDGGEMMITAGLDQANPYADVLAGYASSNDSAQAGSDYNAISGTLAISANTLTTTFTISITEDTLVEGDETLLVNLSAPVGAVLETPISSTITINDNDETQVHLSSSTYAVNESDGGVTITVELDQPNPSADVNVSYELSDGSAQAGSDYVASSGVVTIPSGMTTSSVVVSITDDTILEIDETFQIALSNAMQSVLGTPITATITIHSEDAEPTATPTSTPVPTNTPVPNATETATPTPISTTPPGEILQLTFTAQPTGTTNLVVGDRITYFINLRNQGGDTSTVSISVTLPANVLLDPGSVTPLTSTVASQAQAAELAANTQLEWRLANLGSNELFQASFAVVVQSAGEIRVVVQGGVPDAPSIINGTLTHTVASGTRQVYLPIVRK